MSDSPTPEAYEAAINAFYDYPGTIEPSLRATVESAFAAGVDHRNAQLFQPIDEGGLDETAQIQERIEKEVRAKVAAEIRDLVAGLAEPQLLPPDDFALPPGLEEICRAILKRDNEPPRPPGKPFRVAIPLPPDEAEDPPEYLLVEMAQEYANDGARDAGLVAGPVQREHHAELRDPDGNLLVDEHGDPHRTAIYVSYCTPKGQP